jgi:DNA-binding response OmpR family regulator
LVRSFDKSIGRMEEMEIVLIEDNDDDADNLVRFIRMNFSNKITLIRDGAEAVNYFLFCLDSKPKLILLDIVLPSVDGIELFQIIRSEPSERNLSVVFLVSSPRSKEYIESLGLHPDGYLKKPRGVLPPSRL